ncbi:MAG: MarR family winged helix-turn-helix transcriptional regulator [Anaerotignum sp.]
MGKDVGYLIKVIHEKIKVKADADLKRHNLTLTQSRVLIYLTERGGEATQKEIETFMEVSHPTVVGILSRMEQNGFLTTWMDSENKRNKIVRLTEKALSTGKEITSFIAQNEKEMLVSLTDEEIRALEKSLSVIYKNLSQ